MMRRKQPSDMSLTTSSPIIFHNLKGYDAHFVIKHFQQKYAECINPKKGNVTIDDVNVIPLNGQKYLMFEVSRLRFLDSFQFLLTLLSSLTDMLLKKRQRELCSQHPSL